LCSIVENALQDKYNIDVFQNKSPIRHKFNLLQQ